MCGIDGLHAGQRKHGEDHDSEDEPDSDEPYYHGDNDGTHVTMVSQISTM
ncbi:hypothetical protein [Saccharopolyspora phatthalungensis]|uniref:Uncharacterized protein n=1 Tax=Saccharopolyspora phatthalungensis TaxID=664693 RepID=A0A840Q2V1_9PSEU|nr:hypothetical protein [Saccharopolyspora phatthalungensis]MBB5154804.1 hypothetical protein [Saccharopolyspora phatthalungensis]